MDIYEPRLLMEAYGNVYQSKEIDTELYEQVVEFLISEGYAEDQDDADSLIEELSDEEIDGIIDEATKTVMSVTSPKGKERRLNTTKATGPSRSVTNKNDIQNLRRIKQSREGISFTPSAEAAARRRAQDQISANRQLKVNSRAKYITRNIQQRYNIPDNALSEEFDTYDLVLDYLLDEGYANSEDAALQIMAHMSEDWVDSILDEELTGPRREYALNRAKALRSLSISGYKGPSSPTRDISRNLDVRAGALERLAANTQGRGWENQPRKRGGSGRRGDPKEMDYGVTHDRSQKTPKNLIKSKLLKRAKRKINRR